MWAHYLVLPILAYWDISLKEVRFQLLILPVGDYTSYTVKAGKEGYSIQYNANDPKVLGVHTDIDKNNGFFGIGGNSVVRKTEEYTMDGARHLQGGEVGKLSAQDAACLKAEGAGESTGRMVGASVGASAAPVFTGIPYVGWLISGWMVMLGQDTGAEIGGEIATMMEDCDED